MDKRRGSHGQNVVGRAKALYDYTSDASDELSFKVGDVFEMLGEVPADGWFNAYNTNSRRLGLVPSTYVKVLPDPAKSLTYNTTIVTAGTATEEVYELTVSTNIGDEPALDSHIDSRTPHVELRSEMGTIIEDHIENHNNMTQVELRSVQETGTVTDDHISGGKTELSVSKGNIVEVVHDPVDGWIWIRDITTKQEGYIPIEKLHRKPKVWKRQISNDLKDVLSGQIARMRSSASESTSPVMDHIRQKRSSSESASSSARSSSEMSGGARKSGEMSGGARSSGETSSGVHSSSEMSGKDRNSYEMSGENSCSEDDQGKEDSFSEDNPGVVVRPANDKKITTPRSHWLQTPQIPMHSKKDTHSGRSPPPLPLTPKPKMTLSPVPKDGARSSSELSSGARSSGEMSGENSSSEDHQDRGNNFMEVINKTLATPHPHRGQTPHMHMQSQKGTSSSKTPPPLPLTRKPTITISPVPQETSSEQAVQVLARLNCDKGPMKKGEEVEVLDTSNHEYTLVRHKESKTEFYVKIGELDIISNTPKTVPVKPPPNIKRSKSPSTRPLPTAPIGQGVKPKVADKNIAKQQIQRVISPPPPPPKRIERSPSNAQRDGNSGEWVNEENLADKEYYMGKIERGGIRIILFGPGSKEGTFIVRKSSNADSEYAISVRHKLEVAHYRIRRDHNQEFYIKPEKPFRNIVSLVIYYQNNAELQYNLVAPYNKNTRNNADGYEN